jgi:outer membrane receptor protein involved in Fe transport
MVIKRKHYGTRALIWLALFACAQVYAGDDDYLDMELEQLLQVPVTGSTLRDESIKTVPSAVTVFTHDQLEKLGIDYLYELINLVPGYQFDRNSDNPTNYTFSARGRRNSSQAREVLVIFDGRPFASPRTGAIDIFSPFVPLEQIERVEVIRGPGSALYGSSAFNGVINIVTRAGQNMTKLELGGDDRRRLSANLSKNVGDWSSNLFVRAYEDSGQAFQVQDSFAKVPLMTSDPRKTITVDGALKKNETQLRFAYQRTQGDDFFTLGNTQNGFNSGVYSFKQFSLDQGFHFSDNIKTDIYLGYLDSTQDIHVAILGPGALQNLSQPASSAPLLTNAILSGDSYNLRVTNDWTIDERESALLGVEWKRENENSAYIYNNYDLKELVTRQFPIHYYGDLSHSTPIGSYGSQESIGIYSQYLRDLNQSTRLTLGLRYDDYDGAGEHLSPRLGLVHQINETQTLKLLYGEAYRAPSLGETGLINNPVVVGNPNLSYEIVKTWDLIWMLHVNNSNISLGGFSNIYKNPILAGFEGTTRTYVNGNDEHSDGMEVELQQSLTSQWSLRATYTSFFNLPRSAFREAKQLGSVEVNFNQDRWNWNLLAYHQGARKTQAVNNTFSDLDSFIVFNSKLRYSFKQGYNLSVQMKNVSDLDYATPAQNVGIAQGVPNRGRELSMVFELPL